MKFKNIIIGLTLVLAGVLGGFGCAQRTYVPVITLPLDLRYGAVTVCDAQGNPVVVMNHTYRLQPGTRYALAHELVHVRQIRGSKTCLEFLYNYNSNPRFKLRSEAEAMCGELYLGVSEGMDPSSGYQTLLVNLGLQFPAIPENERISAVPCRPPIQPVGRASK